MDLTLLLNLATLFETIAAWPTFKQPDRVPDCLKWKDRPFQDSEALGDWYLLHFMMNNETGVGLNSIARFVHVPEEMRQDLKITFRQFVADVHWSKLVLKMQIPCPWGVDEHLFEKLADDGYYRTLTLSFTGMQLPHENFGRYPLRMTMVEGKYLGMMDCYNKFVFLLSRSPDVDPETDKRLRKYIDNQYWPEFILPESDDEDLDS